MRDTAVTIAIMAAFGWLAAGTPFRGDQALFTQYAARMHEGEVLYQHLWDVTNPGVYWFYQAAGTLFGFDEDGTHLFEWLWFTAFVLAVQWFIRNRQGVQSFASAVIIGGWYYCTATADPSHLTKAEGLIAFPLFAAIAIAQCERRRFLVAAGIAAGVVVLFKFAFALLLVAGLLPRLVVLLRHRRSGAIACIVIGMLIPWALALAYFARHDAMTAAHDALITAPQGMLQHAVRADLTRLMLSVRWFAETGTPLAVLAVAGLLAFTRWTRDTFLTGYLLILPAALAVILIQRWSWWTYHFQLLSLPLAVLAAVTWPRLCVRIPSWRWYGVLVPLAMVPALHGGSALVRLLPHRMGLTVADRAAARFDAGAAYRFAHADATAMPATATTVFVAGDPLIYNFAHSRQATRMHGWSMEFFSPQLWAQLQQELQSNPPAVIFIDSSVHRYDDLMRTRAPELWHWIQRHYRAAATTPHGQWYERRPGA